MQKFAIIAPSFAFYLFLKTKFKDGRAHGCISTLLSGDFFSGGLISGLFESYEINWTQILQKSLMQGKFD